MDDKDKLDLIRRLVSGDDGRPRPTVAEIAERYQQSVEFRNLKNAENEARRFRLHILPHLGADVAAALTFDRLAWYRDQRSKELCLNRGANGKAKAPKPSTRNREVMQLSAALTWATETKPPILDGNPIRGAPMEEEDNLRQTMPVAAEVDRILFACTPRLRAMVAMKFGSGLRRAEVCSLRLGQVRWDEGLIVLNARDTKTGRPRVTILPERASKIVQRYLDLRDEQDSPYVFCVASGGPVTPRNFLRDFQIACTNAGIKAAEGERMVLHDLRAAFVGHHIELGDAERVIMDMTGHRTHSAFDRYARVQARWLRAAKERADAFDEARRKPPQKAPTDTDDATVIPIAGSRKADE